MASISPEQPTQFVERPGRGTRPRLLPTAVAVAALFATGNAMAGGLPLSGGSTLGDGSHFDSIYTIGNNPAGLTASPRVGFQMGIVSAGFGYELGDLDNFTDTFDDTLQDLDDLAFLGTATAEFDDAEPDEKLDILEELEDRFPGLEVDENTDKNDLQDFLDERVDQTADNLDASLTSLEEDGYLGLQIHARPLMPLIVGRADAGWAFGVDAALDLHGRLTVLNNGVDQDKLKDGDDDAFEAAAYLQGGQSIRTSVSGALRVQEHSNRTVHVGGRVNHYDVELYRTLNHLAGGEEAEDTLSDDLDDNAESSSSLGFDLGAVYQSSYFTGGVSWLNINEPEFDYPDIETAAYADRVPPSESWTMEDQVRFEGALHDSQHRYTLAVSYDNDSVTDMTGAEYQWLSYSAAVSMPWYMKWVPDLRLGYRENRTGTELSYYSLGLNWLGVVSLDVALSDETVESGDDDIPRSAYANLGFQMRF